MCVYHIPSIKIVDLGRNIWSYQKYDFSIEIVNMA